MPGTALFEKPRWLRDLLRFLPLKSQFVLSGNIRDLQACEVVPGTVTAQSFNQTLCDALLDAGYAQVLAWDPLAGFRVLGRPGSEAGATPQVLLDLGLTPVDGAAPAGIDLLGATLQRLVNRSGEPIALIVDFASRLAVRNDALSAAEHQLFTQALVLSHQARSRPAGEQRKPFFNSVLWVVEKEGDLPDWLLVDNPRLRHIPVSKPDQPARRALAPALLRGLGGAGVAEEALQQAAATFVENTEGLLLLDLNAIVQLARVEGLAMERIADAVRRYKVGVTEDPWLKIDRQRIRQADEIVRRRVKGQQHAVTHMLDIVKRAMTGVGASRKGNRPRGVAFLAGPTGVGKTELAKTVTSLLFGDESAYIRFDMSEFSAEHADQRLIGAPPGYVGYDVGGELTNAIREKPFSVVLFDEIEKAHPRILDKFLQILDDGVLTSGRGDRVYFSEALIVFTSNLGIYRQGGKRRTSRQRAPRRALRGGAGQGPRRDRALLQAGSQPPGNPQPDRREHYRLRLHPRRRRRADLHPDGQRHLRRPPRAAPRHRTGRGAAPGAARPLPGRPVQRRPRHPQPARSAPAQPVVAGTVRPGRAAGRALPDQRPGRRRPDPGTPLRWN